MVKKETVREKLNMENYLIENDAEFFYLTGALYGYMAEVQRRHKIPKPEVDKRNFARNVQMKRADVQPVKDFIKQKWMRTNRYEEICTEKFDKILSAVLGWELGEDYNLNKAECFDGLMDFSILL